MNALAAQIKIAVAAVGLGMVSLTVTSGAHGQADSVAAAETSAHQRAEDAFWDGKRHYEAGNFEQAKQLFNRAYSLIQDPNLLFNIAQTHRQLGDCKQALASYEEFLRKAPESSLADSARRHTSALQAICTENPATPSTAPSAPIAVEAASTKRPASSAAGSNAPGSSTPGSAPKAESPLGLVSLRGDLRSEPVARQSSSRIDAWAMGTFIGGLAVGAAAGTVALWNQHRYSTWTDRDKTLAPGLASGETFNHWSARQTENDNLWKSIQRVDRTALFLGIGAGTLVVTSAILHFVIQGKPQREKRSAGAEYDLALGVAPEGLGCVLNGRY